MTIYNKSVQCNLVLEKQIECGDLKLLQKRSKIVQCKPSLCNVHTSTKDPAHSYKDLNLLTVLAAILRKNSQKSNTLRLLPSL